MADDTDSSTPQRKREHQDAERAEQGPACLGVFHHRIQQDARQLDDQQEGAGMPPRRHQPAQPEQGLRHAATLI
jgi:hypothetical protein